MHLDEKLQRSKSTERIDFSKFPSIDRQDSLVRIQSSSKLVVEPNWTLTGDWEGVRYADYQATPPGYDGIYLRSTVADRLKRAAQSLDETYKLVLRAGHRPIEVQRRILRDCADEHRAANPELSGEEALEHARRFVSDPDSTLPSHVCAAAVDVELMDVATGQLLDFGTRINDDSERSLLHYAHLTDDQLRNRMLLLEVMLHAGFASCSPNGGTSPTATRCGRGSTARNIPSTAP
jgi:D-alanyl-D-alanine dipeptidase